MYLKAPRGYASDRQKKLFAWLAHEKFEELMEVGKMLGHVPSWVTGARTMCRKCGAVFGGKHPMGQFRRHQFNHGEKLEREYLAEGHDEADWADMLRKAGLRPRRAEFAERMRGKAIGGGPLHSKPAPKPEPVRPRIAGQVKRGEQLRPGDTVIKPDGTPLWTVVDIEQQTGSTMALKITRPSGRAAALGIPASAAYIVAAA